MKVLGIDPGSHVTGYGVVETQKNGLSEILQGEIRPARGIPLSLCLVTIYNQLLEIIGKASPDAIAVEDIFYGKNVKSLIIQGHVRGVVILAASSCHIPVYEYTPLEVKKAVVGYGRAEKGQVQIMVKTILNLSTLPKPDAADALAVAICHTNFMKPVSI